MSEKGTSESKIRKSLETYLEGALEGGAPFGFIVALGGAVYGAFLGWSILPPETLNIIQAVTAIIGLVLGAVIGFIVGLVGINLFWLAVLLAIIYYLGVWLFSS